MGGGGGGWSVWIDGGGGGARALPPTQALVTAAGGTAETHDLGPVRPPLAQRGGGGGQPRWAVCAAGAGAHQGQTSREGEKDIWWTAGAGYGRPVDRGAWTAKTVKRPRQQPAHPQYANYWAPLTRKRHILPHSAQPQHTNYWAPRTRKRHQQEHRPQRPTESSDPTQHAKGRTGDCPGPP